MTPQCWNIVEPFIFTIYSCAIWNAIHSSYKRNIQCIWMCYRAVKYIRPLVYIHIINSPIPVSISLYFGLYLLTNIEENRKDYIDSLIQGCSNSIADTLWLPQSCTEPSICLDMENGVIVILICVEWNYINSTTIYWINDELFLGIFLYQSCPVRYNLCLHVLKSIKLLIKYTVYPKKYAHGFCFAVLCCGYTLTDFPISIRLTSLALWQSNDCPSASKATLMNMDKYFMWIQYERLHNHNKAKHNKTVCIFLGIYCM